MQRGAVYTKSAGCSPRSQDARSLRLQPTSTLQQPSECSHQCKQYIECSTQSSNEINVTSTRRVNKGAEERAGQPTNMNEWSCGNRHNVKWSGKPRQPVAVNPHHTRDRLDGPAVGLNELSSPHKPRPWRHLQPANPSNTPASSRRGNKCSRTCTPWSIETPSARPAVFKSSSPAPSPSNWNVDGTHSAFLPLSWFPS